VGSDIPGTRDLISDGQTGLLSQVGDAASVTRALERIRTDPVLRAHLVEQGLNCVRESFSAAGMASRYLQLFESLRGPSAGGGTMPSTSEARA
jgi:glycosyltransferase involved in cell wall biosynthesis